MDFEALRALFGNQARQRADAILALENEGEAGFRVTVETVPGRSHMVLVRRRPGGVSEVAQCFALAARVPKGQGLPREVGDELLRKNATLAFGAWGLVQVGNDEYVALIRGLPLALTSPEEALLAVLELASAADAFEESRGQDDF